MNPVKFDKKTLDPRIRDAGVLLNLLAVNGDEVTLNTDWFAAPFNDENLGGVGGRGSELVDLMVDFVGKPDDDAPDDQKWHPIKLKDKPTGLNLVVGTTPSKTGGEDAKTISLGMYYNKALGKSPKIDGTVFILLPVLTFDGTKWDFVLGASTNPAQIIGEVKTDAHFTADGKEYNKLQITGNFVLDGAAPNFKIDFIDKNGGSVDAIKTLADLLNGSAVDWINAVLGISGVQDFLKTKIGSSTSETIASVLVAIKLLEADPLKVADLSGFLHQDPADVAMNLLKEALDILATQEKALIPVGEDGGFWVVREGEDTKKRYGIRATLPDVGKSTGEEAGDEEEGDEKDEEDVAAAPTEEGDDKKNKPQAVLQIGKWFTGEKSAKTSWLKRVDASTDDELEPGAYVYLLEDDGSTLSFNARIELVSVGFDYTGGNDAPLIEVKGVKLGGFEPRLYLSMDLGAGGATNVKWGGGIRMDDLALPLAGSLDKPSGDNPVASSLLASDGEKEDGDKKDKDGKDDAVNPNFSVSAAGMDSTLSVQLYGSDDAETDRIWFPINRTFGPLNCERIGVEWVGDDKLLSTLFDGGVKLGPLGVELLGLSVGMKVTEPTNFDSYKLGLDGLNIEYKTGSIEITGGLLKDTSGKEIAYNGQARVKAGPFGLGALGSYTTITEKNKAGQDTSATSLFVFAFIDYPLGGPGFFFVKGLAGGFGYNRALTMPKMDEVSDMPLVAAMKDPSAIGGKDATPTQALKKMGVWVPPTRGQNFVAAGVKFTTYELVNSIVLLAVQFGNRLEIDLLGVATIKLPQVGPTFAYAELDLMVVIAPDEGEFRASLVLGSESYVLDPKCKITGGFAFYAWFGTNKHAGNFVVTIGGYHPAFTPPDFYPVIPRLGFKWPVTDEISITGGAYFALTPSCGMGGGSLDVVFSSGGLKAWFSAHADLIIYWKPFYFDAAIGVEIGASYTFKVFGSKVTLSISLGADLELWGPPTGGKVHVSWFVISFTVRFGEDKLERVPAIDWPEFAATLPGPGESSATKAMAATTGDAAKPKPKVVSINIAEGLQKQMNQNGVPVWFIRPDEFTWFTKTTVPATGANIGGSDVTKNNAGVDAFTDVAVRPMRIASVTKGSHTISMSGVNSLDAFLFDLDLEAQPEAMWGKPVLLSKLEADAKLIDNCITGVKGLHPKPHAAIVGPPVIDAEKAFTFVILDKGEEWLPIAPATRPATTGGATPCATTLDTIHDTLTGDATARTDVFNALASLGVDAGANGTLTHLAANPTAGFIASPMTGSVA